MTKILVTVPSGESLQLKRVLVGLGIKQMILSEVPGDSGRETAPRAFDHGSALGSVRPKVRIEIVAPDVRVEPIVQALLRRKKTG
jgi:nitrogen regulatory protein PII